MKYVFSLLLVAATLSACQKDPNVSVTVDQGPFTVERLLDSVAGTYVCTAYCSSGSNTSGYTYDTLYSVPLEVHSLDDTVLYIYSYELQFVGNLDSADYSFYQPASGGGHLAVFSADYKHVEFSYWNGGLGGGSGCLFVGDR